MINGKKKIGLAWKPGQKGCFKPFVSAVTAWVNLFFTERSRNKFSEVQDFEPNP